MTFKEYVNWSPESLKLESFLTSSHSFPILVKVTLGYYGLSEEQSVYTDNVLLLHGWGIQQRLVARNRRGQVISIPADGEYKIKYDGLPGGHPQQKGVGRPVKDLVQQYSPPFLAHFTSKESFKIYNGPQVLNPKEFGQFTVESMHLLNYLIASNIDEAGAVDVSGLSYLPDILDVELSIAKSLKGSSEIFLNQLLQMYVEDTEELRQESSAPIKAHKLSYLMGYDDSRKCASPKLVEPDVSRQTPAASAAGMPLSPVPDDKPKSGAETQPITGAVRPQPITGAERSSPTDNVYENYADASSLPTTSNIKDFTQDVVSEVKALFRLKNLKSNKKDLEEDTYSGFSDSLQHKPGTPMATLHPLMLENAGENLDLPPPLVTKPEQYMGLGRPARKDYRHQVYENITLESASEGAGVRGGGTSPTYENTIPHSPGVKTSTPTATVQPLPPPLPKRDRISRSEISPQSHPTYAYCRQISEPVMSQSVRDSGWAAGNRQRLASDPGLVTSPNPAPKQTGIGRLQDVPTDTSKLTVAEVGACLSLLNMESYIDTFKTMQIDGELLMEMESKDFSELGMDNLKAKKMYLFVNGWRPKIAET